MSRTKPLYISCGIFRSEMEYLVREKALDVDVLYLDAALHVNFDRLKARLTGALEQQRVKGVDLKVLYGRCHPEMKEIVERYGATRMDAVNCLEAIVGREEIRNISAEAKTFFLTAGWVNNWDGMFDLGRKDFQFDFSSMFRDYERIVVFETEVIPLDEVRIERFRSFANLPVERRRISLDRFLNLIKGL